MAAVSKPMSFMPELKTFTENLKGAPYADLLTAPAAAGWDVHSQEIEAVGQVDGTTLVRYAVSIGRDGKFEFFDNVTVKTGPGPGPVSIAARLLLEQELVWLFFRRLPEPVPTRTVDVGQQPAGDIVLPEEEPDTGGEYVEESAPISRRAAAEAAKMPSLIDHLEPDGVPVFIDFDNIPDQFSTAEIIAQVLVEIDHAAVRFDSLAQLDALFTKNEAAIGVNDSFLRDLGTIEDRKTMVVLLEKHKARLETAGVVREVKIPGGKGSVVPRRRKVAA